MSVTQVAGDAFGVMVARISAAACSTNRHTCWAPSRPSAASNGGMSQEKPRMSCPPLRPDAPQPTRLASTMATFFPARARRMAVYKPVKPAPTMATSTSSRSCNAGRAGAQRRNWRRSSWAHGGCRAGTWMPFGESSGCIVGGGSPAWQFHWCSRKLGAWAVEGIVAKRVGKEPSLRPLLRTVAVATAGKMGGKWDFSPPVAADALLPPRLLDHCPENSAIKPKEKLWTSNMRTDSHGANR